MGLSNDESQFVQWTLEFTAKALKSLSKINKSEQQRIVDYLSLKVCKTKNPQLLGRPLRGKNREYYRYRIGSYRVIASIENERFIVLVIEIGHRREVYKHI